MVKYSQTIRRQKPTNYLKVFDHFVGLALKGLISLFVDLWTMYIAILFSYSINKLNLEIMNKNDGCSSLLGMEIWSWKYCLNFKARQIVSFNIGLPMI